MKKIPQVLELKTKNTRQKTNTQLESIIFTWHYNPKTRKHARVKRNTNTYVNFTLELRLPFKSTEYERTRCLTKHSLIYNKCQRRASH